MSQPDASTQAILSGDLSLADKIRRLSALGHSRSRIADLVGRSYQQVRQVLVEDERRARRVAEESKVGAGGAAASGVAQASPPFEEIWRLEVEADGVVRLPLPVQAALGVGPGSMVICELEGGGFRLLGPTAALERARSYLTRLPPPGDRSLSQELIADRRAEFIREESDD
jgi:hypothetical protein